MKTVDAHLLSEHEVTVITVVKTSVSVDSSVTAAAAEEVITRGELVSVLEIGTAVVITVNTPSMVVV